MRAFRFAVTSVLLALVQTAFAGPLSTCVRGEFGVVDTCTLYHTDGNGDASEVSGPIPRQSAALPAHYLVLVRPGTPEALAKFDPFFWSDVILFDGNNGRGNTPGRNEVTLFTGAAMPRGAINGPALGPGFFEQTGDVTTLRDRFGDTFIIHSPLEAVARLGLVAGQSPNKTFSDALVGSSANPEKKSLFISNNGHHDSVLTGRFADGDANFVAQSPAEFSISGSITTQQVQGTTRIIFPSTSREYAFIPQSRGSKSVNIAVTSNGGEHSQRLVGRGVAPVQQTTVGGPAMARVGTQLANATRIDVTNIGDGNRSGAANSNLRGNIGAAPSPISGAGTGLDLADGTSGGASYAFAPTQRGQQDGKISVHFDNGSADGTNQAQALEVLLQGTGVGPVFGSNHGRGGGVDFASLLLGSSAKRLFAISNRTTDAGVPDDLLRLTVLGFEITGADADLFTLSGFNAGMSLLPTDADAVFELTLNALRKQTAVDALLTFFTDEDAALGAQGNSFAFRLSGSVRERGSAPEPATWMLIALGGIALARMRNRLAKQG